MPTPAEHRAEAARPPDPTRELIEARAKQATHLRHRENLERKSVLRGAILLAIIALAASITHAGWDRVFIPRWWRQW